MLYEEYGFIGIMIGYLERILNIIADFFARITGGGSSTTAPETTVPATTEAPVTEVIIYRN